MPGNETANHNITEVCACSNLCGESPLWDAGRRRLIWTDSDSTGLFEYAPDTGTYTQISDDIQVSSIVIDKKGYILLGRGIWAWPQSLPACAASASDVIHGNSFPDSGTVKIKLLDTFEDEVLFFNDSIAGPDGCIYAGTYYWEEGRMLKYGKLYRIRPDGRISILDDGIRLSNGMAFSSCNDLFYYADSGERLIYVYDYNKAEGGLKNRKVFVRHKGPGIPDGITVDSEGYIWCAMWYEGRIYRYDPDGKTVRVIKCPVRQVSSITFGGDDMDALYITSANSPFISSLMPAGFEKVRAVTGGSLYCIKTGNIGIMENKVSFI